MAGKDERSHYEVLGVPPNATPQQLRDAHRQMALVLHPDRHVQSSSAERRLADRRMREVNVAWSVLSDPVSRVSYDRTLRAGTTAPRPTVGGDPKPEPDLGGGSSPDDPDAWIDSGEEFDPDDEPVPEWQYWMFKRGPVIAMFLVAAVLFVATAYAGSSGKSGSDGGQGGPSTVEVKRECVSIATAGRSAVRVPCSSQNDGRIVTKVQAALDCPAATSYVLVDDEFLCVSTDPSVVGSDSGG